MKERRDECVRRPVHRAVDEERAQLTRAALAVAPAEERTAAAAAAAATISCFVALVSAGRR